MRYSPVLIALVMTLLAATSSATIKVQPEQAEKFRRDLRAAVDRGTSSLGSLVESRAHAQRLQELESRSKRLFGDVFNPKFGACVKAASLIKSVWVDQISLASKPGAVAAGGLSRLSFDAGVEYAACRIAIDELTPGIPAECLVRYDASKRPAVEIPRPAHCPKLP
ncbi:MAG: hypothetical protein AB7P37_21210 [Ramlibacter sp.]